ncbi:GspH/FimT family protein [Pseudomonas sp. PCH199]|uniref:GspH/FimT family pseudopilin n=1 Tax=unclassified Pseudomonas TaxID=196821 RepID=UPI000BDBFD79|nr:MULTISPECIES: GspH/FimT family protein [unclassified Pseudomonas]MCW8275821.1 GspH/FimT family protein [Pseudomonas sp. PCH199]PAM83898.1 general secretion pathway protein GspH [Pseudomonas sp. ERMR1:02]
MHQRGFSLIELLMGLTIVGIVLHLVSPAFAAVMESNYREEAARSLVSGMRSARNEAISRNQTVMIHGIDGDWSQGWRIILDVSGKGFEDDSNPLLMERRSGIRLPVYGNRNVGTSIRFNNFGRPLSGGFSSGTLHICAAREPVSLHQVVLASNGRVSLRSSKTEQALCVGGEDSEQGTNA